jgi:hypothetical protein
MPQVFDIVAIPVIQTRDGKQRCDQRNERFQIGTDFHRG